MNKVMYTYKGPVGIQSFDATTSQNNHIVDICSDAYTNIVCDDTTDYSDVIKLIKQQLYNKLYRFSNWIACDYSRLVINEFNISLEKTDKNMRSLCSTYIGPVSLCLKINLINGRSYIREIANFNGIYKLTVMCDAANILNYASIDMQLIDFIDGIRSSGIIEKELNNIGCTHINRDEGFIVLNPNNVHIWNDAEEAEKQYEESCRKNPIYHHITILKDHYLTEDICHISADKEDDNNDQLYCI